VPSPVELTVRTSAINGLLGTSFGSDDVVGLLEPLGIRAEPDTGDRHSLRVTVPTFRPDIRPAPLGEADIAEEVARTYGYSRIARRQPAWPQPGRLTARQRDRRLLRDVLAGIGCSEAWTATFVSDADQAAAGFEPPYVEVANPLVDDERFLRSSMVPGLIRAALHNAERRNPGVRLFELGSVFLGGDRRSGVGAEAVTTERACVLLADDGDDAWTAVAAWRTVADALGIADWALGEGSPSGPAAGAVHPYRSRSVSSAAAPASDGITEVGDGTVLGVVGELAPQVVAAFGLSGPDGRPRRVGWLDLDLGMLLDRQRVPRRSKEAREVSRFPSSDVDLAFVVDDAVPAGAVDRTLRTAGGPLLESLELFDVYRGPSVVNGSRSLAFRLRFCAPDRTLTDQEVGDLRVTCIEAATAAHGAVLR
jgi:phenylalanyl-tRNA synthetase beta chain